MKEIRDIISKPSEALRAMVDGLLEQSQREDFNIQMNDWGRTDGKVCFGCAATCTLQKLAGKNLVPTNNESAMRGFLSWRAESLDFYNDEIDEFEDAINDAREGDLRGLFDFFGMDSSEIKCFYPWYLGTYDWREQLPKVEKTIEYLIAQGV